MSLAALCQKALPIDPSETRLVLAAVCRAATDRFGSLDRRLLGDGVLRRVPDPGGRDQRAYAVGEYEAFVEPSSGRVVRLFDTHFGLSSDASSREISDEEARRLAIRFLADGNGPYATIPSVPRMGPFDPPGLMMDVAYAVGGVPYDDYSAWISLDPASGRVVQLSLGREPTPPTPPASLTPRISAYEARLQALRVLGESGALAREPAQPHAVLSVSRLTWSLPEDVAEFFTPKDRIDVAKGRTRLVYDVVLANARADGSAVLVRVDASEGRVLQEVGFGGPRSDRYGKVGPSPTPFVVPDDFRTWRIAENGSPWGPPLRGRIVPAAERPYHPTRKLLLTDGQIAFTAGYDPISTKLGFQDESGKLQVFCVGLNLADFLARLSQPSPLKSTLTTSATKNVDCP